MSIWHGGGGAPAPSTPQGFSITIDNTALGNPFNLPLTGNFFVSIDYGDGGSATVNPSAYSNSISYNYAALDSAHQVAIAPVAPTDALEFSFQNFEATFTPFPAEITHWGDATFSVLNFFGVYGAWVLTISATDVLRLVDGFSAEGMFQGHTELTDCNFLAAFEMHHVGSAQRMFFGCSSLADVPAGAFDAAAHAGFNLREAFTGCALTEQSVTNVLASVVATGLNAPVSDGYVSVDGGTNATPNATALAHKATLESRGWIVEVNT